MRLFHISYNKLNGIVLKPTIPDNILTKVGVENNTIKRVSFAPTVDHALLAIGFNRLKTGPKVLDVFEPENYNSIKFLHNKHLKRKGYVPDADQTKEYWILNPVRVKYAGQIKLIKPKTKFVEIKINDRQKIKNYYWEYKVLDGNL